MDPKTVVTREVGPLSMRAAVRPGSADLEKRTVEFVWTTGARVLRGYYDKFWEELSLDPKHVRMERLQSGRAPVLDSHSSYSLGSILGVVESARLEKDQGVAVVRFPKAEDDPEADKIFRKVADGIIANVSVGYRVYRAEKVEDGEDKIPVMLVTDWEPIEVSLVSMGADAGAGTRAVDGAGNMCEFVSTTHTSEERKMEPKTETPVVEKPAAPVVPATESTRSEPETDTRAAVEAATRAERERASSIRNVVRKANLDGALAERLISDGSSIEQARAAVLDELATRSDAIQTDQHVRIEAGETADQKFANGAVASLLARANVAQMVRDAQKSEIFGERLAGTATDPGEFRGWKLETIARECLERRGTKTRGMSGDRIFTEALSQRSGGMASASDFPVLLESAMGKTMLAAYAVAPETWRRICAVKDVPDFRAANFYRNGTFGTLDKVNENGEFKQKAIPDGEKATITADTYGDIIAITRKALVNDDLGAFIDLAQRFGHAAARTIEAKVYDMIKLNSGLGPTQTDGQPLFHSANRKNVSTGAALSVEALDADAALLAAQKDPSGNATLDLRPAVLLVARGLEGAAKLINAAQYNPGSSKLMVPNIAAGMFRDVVGTANLTGNARYVLADPAVSPVFAVAFIGGDQAPKFETKDGWRVDGTEMKLWIDFGVASMDFRGAVYNAGQ